MRQYDVAGWQIVTKLPHRIQAAPAEPIRLCRQNAQFFNLRLATVEDNSGCREGRHISA
jgi:hypothetical protein